MTLDRFLLLGMFAIGVIALIYLWRAERMRRLCRWSRPPSRRSASR